MSLDPLSTWTSTIQALPPVPLPATGFLNLGLALASLMAKVQAGPTGTPGIFTFAAPIFASGLSSLVPSASTAWATTMATAWGAAVTASVITPGTVTDPTWTASLVDAVTLPAAAATLGASIAAAQTIVSTQLNALAALMANPLTPPAQLMLAPEKTAQAFRDGTLAFSFLCIGLVIAVPSPLPVPLPFAAQ